MLLTRSGRAGCRVCTQRHTCVGLHAHTASPGSSGPRVSTHRHTCVGCAHTHSLTGLIRAWVYIHRYTCVGCTRAHSHTGLTKARDQHTQAHLHGVCTHTQPHRAHQGAGSAHTGTPAWGVHMHTTSPGSPGHGVCTQRHMCVGCARTHSLTGLTRAQRQFCAHSAGGEAFLAKDEGRAQGRPGSRRLNALFSSLRSLDFVNSYYVKAFLQEIL